MARAEHEKVSLSEVLELARKLSPIEKVRLIALIAPEIEHDLATKPPVAGRSLLGRMKDLGPAPSAEEIDAGRAEAWGNFPRETI